MSHQRVLFFHFFLLVSVPSRMVNHNCVLKLDVTFLFHPKSRLEIRSERWVPRLDMCSLTYCFSDLRVVAKITREV